MSPLDAASTPAEWLEARHDAAVAVSRLAPRLLSAWVRAYDRYGLDSDQMRTVSCTRADLSGLLVEFGGEWP